jgi:hypothetical protein
MNSALGCMAGGQTYAGVDFISQSGIYNGYRLLPYPGQILIRIQIEVFYSKDNLSGPQTHPNIAGHPF